jgi:hypothetical protein
MFATSHRDPTGEARKGENHLSFLRASVATLLFIIAAACSGSGDTNPETAHIQILDEIPAHIQEVENLTIYPGDSEPPYSIELVMELTYGERGEPFLTTIQNSVIDDQGRVIILNTDASYTHDIFVYNSDASFHKQLGGRGKGPGEYGFVLGVQSTAGNVYVRDITNQRLNIYNTTDYSFEKSMPIEQLAIRSQEDVQGLELGLIKTRRDGNHLVGFYEQISDDGWPSQTYLLMDDDGNRLDYESSEFRSSFKAAALRGGSWPMPFMGTSIMRISEIGELYTVWNQDFLIKKYDINGAYQSAIYYSVAGSPFDLNYHAPTPFFDESDVLKALNAHDVELPKANPVIASIMIDDEYRIWVAVPAGEERDHYEWWILDESGKLIAKLHRPIEKTIFDIKDGYLYAKEIDEETEVEYVVKYRMEFEEAK